MSSPNPEPSGPPLRALAMVLISLAILFAAIGALSLTGSDDDSEDAAAVTSEVAEAPATTADSQGFAAPRSSAAQPTTTTQAATSSVEPSDIEVRVLNNSNVAGLAAETASTLTSEGWTVAETGNYSEDQIAATTVFYDTSSGAEAAATEIAGQLGVTAEAAPDALASYGSGVIVVVTQ